MDTLGVRASGGRGPGGCPGPLLKVFREFLADDIILKASLGPTSPQVPGGVCRSLVSRGQFSLRAAHPGDGLSEEFLIFHFLTQDRVRCLCSQLNRMPCSDRKGK